jgi:prepilin signal peptidase PulO-like enzyme (type II secretory pathway)
MYIAYILFWFSLLLSASIFDIRSFRIPNTITLGGFPALLLLNYVGTRHIALSPLYPSFLCFTIMLLIFLLSKEKLGMGDVKLTLIISFPLGIYYWLVSLLLASLSALLFVGVISFRRNEKKNSPLPFVPFLTFGAILAYLAKRGGYFVP